MNLRLEKMSAKITCPVQKKERPCMDRQMDGDRQTYRQTDRWISPKAVTKKVNCPSLDIGFFYYFF